MKRPIISFFCVAVATVVILFSCSQPGANATATFESNSATIALRLSTTVLLINSTAVWLVLAAEGLPQILAVFHGILAVIMPMRIAMITKGGVTKT